MKKTVLKCKNFSNISKCQNLFRNGYKCKCEELDDNYYLSDDDVCYIFNVDINDIVLDTEPTTTTVTAEPISTIFESTVSPSLQPPEEITEEETTTIKSRKD